MLLLIGEGEGGWQSPCPSSGVMAANNNFDKQSHYLDLNLASFYCDNNKPINKLERSYSVKLQTVSLP